MAALIAKHGIIRDVMLTLTAFHVESSPTISKIIAPHLPPQEISPLHFLQISEWRLTRCSNFFITEKKQIPSFRAERSKDPESSIYPTILITLQEFGVIGSEQKICMRFM
jgi:hypothetical protein